VTKIESSEKQKTYCKTVGFCERQRFKIEPTNWFYEGYGFNVKQQWP